MDFNFIFSDILPTSIIHGLLLSLVGLGIYITYKLLNFIDLSAESIFILGASIFGTMINNDINYIISFLSAILACSFIGLSVTYISLKYKINSMLITIIIAMIIYSLNLKILGVPNIPLNEIYFPFNNESLILKGLFITSLITLTFYTLINFLKTEVGLRFRLVGLNPKMARAYSINQLFYVTIGTIIANSLIAIAGIMHSQNVGYVDINMANGLLIQGLASVMIGEMIMVKYRKSLIFSPLIGAIIYSSIENLIMLFDFIKPTDFRMVTGILVLISIILNSKRKVKSLAS
ncbi:MAG: hypothetical protein J0H68_04465 [Sphingobacteriia bacterium]|nr:hypothetical protein [Sphingobacteriia bacterium]